MVDFASYMALSIIETFSMLFLAFRLFKIDIMPKEMVFTSAILAFFSFVMRHEYGLVQVDVVVQAIVMMVFIWLLFKIHIFYAFILMIVACQAYMFIQTFYYFFMISFGLFSSDNADFTAIMVILLQLLTAGSAIALGQYVAIKRKGFDYIPDNPHVKVKFNQREWTLLALGLPSVFIIASTMYFVEKQSSWFFLVPFCYAVVLFGYLYNSFKKDREGNERIG